LLFGLYFGFYLLLICVHAVFWWATRAPMSGLFLAYIGNCVFNEVMSLGLGADHYLGKGCDLDELAAVLAALERRLGLQRLQSPAVQPAAPNWTLEVGPRRLLIAGAPAVPLSQQDLLVLRCLMSRPGENISRRQIIEELGFDYLDYDQRRLDTQMRRLRRRVEDVSGQTLPVKTLRNSGYCFYQPAKVQA